MKAAAGPNVGSARNGERGTLELLIPATLAPRKTRLCGRVLTSPDFHDEQQESGKEKAGAPSDSDESQNFHAADTVEPWIANDIDGQREAAE
jgi:hypothetical protein